MALFQEIPQFIQDGEWECDFSFPEFLKFMNENIEELQLNVDPDFQRPHVWTEEQQIAWLEFFLMGGRTGRTFYLNHPGWRTNYKGEFLLVDGKQRYQALKKFVNNEIKVFGVYYKDYEDRPDILRHSVKVNVNTLSSRSKVLKWYLGFNGGGTPHTKKELDRVKELLELEEHGKKSKPVKKVARESD